MKPYKKIKKRRCPTISSSATSSIIIGVDGEKKKITPWLRREVCSAHDTDIEKTKDGGRDMYETEEKREKKQRDRWVRK